MPTDPSSDEDFARRLKPFLEASTERISPDMLERLAGARRLALTRARTPIITTAVTVGHHTLAWRRSKSSWAWLGGLMALTIMMIVLNVGWQEHQQQVQRDHDVEQDVNVLMGSSLDESALNAAQSLHLQEPMSK